ncbi:hypothetical protein [Deinococcus sp.]|uniref:hypothetical protein n=1 Tax=Deinococcus sp. TaxID=47478 RepID=UPI003C7BD5B0
MGEAKRRRQLGLMPTVENREVVMTRDGEVTGDALPPAVLERLKTWAETGARWDARYRTTFIGTGLPRELLNTEDDLMAIPVPDRMRLKLGLLSGSAQWLEREQELSPESFFDDGGQPRQLNVRATEYSYNGQWSELPEFEPDSTLRYLTQHPAVVAPPKGEAYVLTVWHGGERDGQTEVEPTPPAEHEGALIQAAQVFLGESDEEWLDDHLSNLSGFPAGLDDEAEGEQADATDEQTAPLARRLTLTLSPVPLVLSPTVQVLSRSGDMDVAYTQGQEAYSDDGETWTEYPRVQDTRERLQDLLESMGIGDISELEALMAQEGSEEADIDSRTIEAEVISRSPGGAAPDDASKS